ncbi:MAG TPA: TMEM43 family protein [Candidatus Woesebacteria bacterium]|nr:TMEM43 family protein [Candidatus Woesebacteria bacterium]
MTEQELSPKTTTVDQRSWFQRLGTSLRGVLTGLLLFIIAFPILIWNEGQAIQTHRDLEAGASIVENSDSTVIDPAQDGKLIYFTGETRTPSILTDSTFPISENAIKLKRIVEVYQWSEITQTETVEKNGGGTETTTTYSYQKVWDDQLIDSTSFQEQANYRNPQSKPLENEEQVANPVSVGAYIIPDRLLSSLSDYERLNLSSDLLTTLPNAQQEQWQVFNNYIFRSADPSNPEIGDARIWYQIIRPGTVSVVAQQNGDNLEPYRTKDGKSIEMIRTGAVPAEEMSEGIIQVNPFSTWLFRILAVIFMYIGLNTLLVPISTLLHVIPLFAKVFLFANKLLTLVITLVLSLITIGIMWLIYQPLIGLAILLVAVAVVFLFSKLRKKTAPTTREKKLI